MNFTAQLASMACRSLQLPVHSFTKYDGTPIRPAEIVGRVEEVLVDA